MLRKSRVWTDADTYIVTLGDNDLKVCVELSLASLENEEPTYLIDNKVYSQTEMLELMAAILGARKNWEDYKNGNH